MVTLLRIYGGIFYVPDLHDQSLERPNNKEAVPPSFTIAGLRLQKAYKCTLVPSSLKYLREGSISAALSGPILFPNSAASNRSQASNPVANTLIYSVEESLNIL